MKLISATSIQDATVHFQILADASVAPGERILSRLLDTHLTRDVLIETEDFRRRGHKDYTRGLRRRSR